MINFEIIPARTERDQTIIDWYERKSMLNPRPRYQRVGGLWSTEARQLFIDTIINGFDVPKLYLHRAKLTERNDYIFSIIDGQQRLSCIFDFIDNKFPLSKDFNYIIDPSIVIGSKFYDDISNTFPKIISRFNNYILDIVQVITEDEELISEMFLRLNEGISLNNSERRLAKISFLNDEVRKMVNNHKFFSLLKFSNRRYSYEELFTKLILIEKSDIEGQKVPSLTKRNLDNLVEENNVSNEFINVVLDETKSKLDRMYEVFSGINELLSLTIIPIYYSFIKLTQKYCPDNIKSFLISFEQLRRDNRLLSYSEQIPALIEFDRLNQQGANSTNSIRTRVSIIQMYFEEFLKKGKVIPLDEDLENEILDYNE